MTSDTKCLVTNLRKWKPRGYNWLNNNYRQLFSPAMTFSLQYIETFPFLLWLRGNEMMSWKFKTPTRENIASHGKQAIFTKCFSYFYERLAQSFPRCSLWAWVWDSRNKGPVVGRNSDIRNETPGGWLEMNPEVVISGTQKPDTRWLNHFRPRKLNFDPGIKSVYGSVIGM